MESDAVGVELDVAVDAAAWIRSRAVETGEGLGWRRSEADADVDRSLYAGSAGVCVFLLELAAATGDAEALELAGRAADDLAANLAGFSSSGLYDGLAGAVFVLATVAERTDDESHRRAAETGLALLLQRARRSEHGVTWGGRYDVISGDAGIGMTLLWLADRLAMPEAADAALASARHLAAVGDPSPVGRRWSIGPELTRHWPNFSHGTAGVGCLLAMIARRAADVEVAAAALEAGGYLRAVAREDGLVFHSDGDGGEDLHYLGWCHGPPGTARLFGQLGVLTGDPVWARHVRGLAATVATAALPPRLQSGLWENVGRCCGYAGICDFLLTVDADLYADAIAQISALLVQRAIRDRAGARWVHAEHRTQPDLRAAQPGLMQGAAGIGLTLLHIDGERAGRRTARVPLPDEPGGTPWQS